MRLRIEVQTPPGQATGSERKLRAVFLGVLKRPANTWTSPDDSTFYWEIDATPKEYIRVTKNVGRFQGAMSYLFDKKLFRKTIEGLANKKEDVEIVRGMLIDGTRLHIIKEATAEELQADGRTFWQKMKDTFKRTNP